MNTTKDYIRRETKWEISPAEAIALQKKLSHLIKIKPYNGPLRWIGGADVSFNMHSSKIFAGFVILDAHTMDIVDVSGAVKEVKFPYIPGLLSFREIPPLLKAWQKLNVLPDVLIFDGHGLAHPRRLGIASHAGLLLNMPTLGCAKSVLAGKYTEPKHIANSQTPLRDPKNNQQIGVALRTKNKVKPVYVSPGHLMDFKSSVRILKKCIRNHRVPEPTRLAHLFVNELRTLDNDIK